MNPSLTDLVFDWAFQNPSLGKWREERTADSVVCGIINDQAGDEKLFVDIYSTYVNLYGYDLPVTRLYAADPEFFDKFEAILKSFDGSKIRLWKTQY